MTNRFSTPHEKPSQHKKRQVKTCRWSKYGAANISLVPPQSIPVFEVRSPCGWPVFVRFVSYGSQSFLRCRVFRFLALCKSTSIAFEPRRSLLVWKHYEVIILKNIVAFQFHCMYITFCLNDNMKIILFDDLQRIFNQSDI